MKSKVVYKIKCADSEDFYVGKTLKTRINENKTGKNSSISEHGQSLGKKIGKMMGSWTVLDQIAYYYRMKCCTLTIINQR